MAARFRGSPGRPHPRHRGHTSACRRPRCSINATGPGPRAGVARRIRIHRSETRGIQPRRATPVEGSGKPAGKARAGQDHGFCASLEGRPGLARISSIRPGPWPGAAGSGAGQPERGDASRLTHHRPPWADFSPDSCSAAPRRGGVSRPRGPEKRTELSAATREAPWPHEHGPVYRPTAGRRQSGARWGNQCWSVEGKGAGPSWRYQEAP
jgi:hypothetical protein